MESTSRTLVCSVLFLDIAEYSKKPVAEQLELKEAFNRMLCAALDQVAPRDRMILDTGDGAAVSFSGDPEDALFTAMSVLETAPPLELRLGINLGPVRMVKDLNGRMNIIGDGINVAQRVMSFAEPGQLLVSRSFYEVVSCLSHDYVNLFQHEGARTDKHVRDHEVYSVAGGTMPGRRATPLRPDLGRTASAGIAAIGRFGRRRSLLIGVPVLVAMFAAGTVGTRAIMKSDHAAGMDADLPTTSAETPRNKIARLQPASLATSTEKSTVPAQGARIELAVAPWGDVWVDGTPRGATPPLRVLQISPGRHTIEVRNGNFPSHIEHVNVKAGQSLRVRHKFN